MHTPARARARPEEGHLTHVDSSLLICALGEAPLRKRCLHLARLLRRIQFCARSGLLFAHNAPGGSPSITPRRASVAFTRVPVNQWRTRASAAGGGRLRHVDASIAYSCPLN